MNALTRLTDTLRSDAQARAAAAVAALLLGVLIGLVALIIAGIPHTAQATPPIIIVESTPTAAPVAMVAAYAAPGGAQLGDIPADTPIRYRDSRALGWVGADWQGGVVWFQADGDASALADLAPQPTEIPAPPVAQQGPGGTPPAQVIYIYQAPPEQAPPPPPPPQPDLPQPAPVVAPVVAPPTADLPRPVPPMSDPVGRSGIPGGRDNVRPPPEHGGGSGKNTPPKFDQPAVNGASESDAAAWCAAAESSGTECLGR